MSLMKQIFRSLLAGIGLAFTAAASANAQTSNIIVGITDADQVVFFSRLDPSITTTPVPITGVAAGQTVVGADFRPATGELFILGYNVISGEARLYTLNATSPTTATATPVGAATFTLLLGSGDIGFDFNPTVDRIRVVSAIGANYRLNPVTGTLVTPDGNLNYAAGDVNNGTPPTIGAAAYTNSFIGSEATTLFDYDATLNVLASQIPPNNGTLNTIGSSGITADAGTSADMDILYDSATGTNTAYLIANVGGSASDNLYTVNLSTGAVTPVGTSGGLIGATGGTGTLKDIAIPIARSVPSGISAQLVYGLTRVNRNLITFDAAQPGIIRKLMSVTGVGGTTAGTTERLVGMDVRPADLKLYALGYNDTTGTAHLYTIDTGTGAATRINDTDRVLPLGAGPIGFDFNPAADRIRIVGANGGNFRMNPATGAFVVDGTLAYSPTDLINGSNTAPRVGSVAYTNSFAGTTSTKLFALDDSIGALLTIDTPNNGVLRTAAAGFFMPTATDRTTDMDFYYDSASLTNVGYFVGNRVGSVDSFYTFTTASTTPTAIGRVGLGVQLMDIAAQLRFTNTTISVAELQALPGVSVYPNPTRDYLTIEGAGTGTRAMLTDATGRLVRSASASASAPLRFDMRSLSPGLYSLVVTDAQGRAIGATKVVKQ